MTDRVTLNHLTKEQRATLARLEATRGAIHSWAFSDAARAAALVIEPGRAVRYLIDLDGSVEDEHGNPLDV